MSIYRRLISRGTVYTGSVWCKQPDNHKIANSYQKKKFLRKEFLSLALKTAI